MKFALSTAFLHALTLYSSAHRANASSDTATVMCGGGSTNKKCNYVTKVAPKTERYGARCCSPSAFFMSEFKDKNGCTIHGGTITNINGPGLEPASLPGLYCPWKLTYDEAEAHCANLKAKICTQAELEQKCAKATGCHLNWELVWTYNPTPATAAPTASPTASPTAKITGAPTASPTAAATGAPTASPTGAPTASPTVAATGAPTASPTATPTKAPTSAPTVEASSTPSAFASSTPTMEKTIPLFPKLGTANTCAVDESSKLWCWGSNQYHLMGTGDSSLLGNRYVPTRVGTMTGDVVAFDVGFGATFCAIDSTGQLFCWGNNTYGELGVGDKVDRTSATPVSFPNGAVPVDVVLGKDYTFAIDTNGKLYVWGRNYTGNYGNGTSGVASESDTPIHVPHANGVVQVSGGASSACLLDTESKLYCWGWNGYGMVTLERLPNSVLSPYHVPIPGGGVTKIDQFSSEHGICAINDSAELYCWGNNADGQLGQGVLFGTWYGPPKVPVPGDVIDVAVGFIYKCAITSDNKLWCWGDNQYGQLGTGACCVDQLSPVQSIALDPVYVDAGQKHTCSVDSAGQLSCWGWNTVGKVGTGETKTYYKSPVAINGVGE